MDHVYGTLNYWRFDKSILFGNQLTSWAHQMIAFAGASGGPWVGSGSSM